MVDSNDLLLTFESDCDDEDVPSLALSSVRGHERLSIPYEFELVLELAQDQGLSIESMEAMLAEPCRFTIGETTISGVLEEVTLEPTKDSTRTTYRVMLAPRVSRLERTVRSRVFQNMTPPAIVEAVLTEHSIPFESSYLASYPTSEYTVQFEESDLDFIRRLMEHAGIFFFFEQAPDGETMQLADDNRAFVAHESYAQLSFSELEDTQSWWIGPMGRTIRPQTAALTLRDYNWRAPFMAEDGSMTERQLQLVAPYAVDAVTGSGYERRYGDHFKDEADGFRLAQVRAEEVMVERVVVSGSVRAMGLSPGHRFETSGMPIAELEAEYAVVGLETQYDSRTDAPELTQHYEAIPVEVPFRPARLTDRPIIAGFMHAVVDGEVQSTAAPIDEHGRYKVIMPYDEAAASGGRASRWIRMAQSSAGADYGMHLPLHIGTEVVVFHLDGDPDRPVIASAVPNVDTMSPVVDANATQSRIKTRNNILFELEDDA